MSVRVMSWNTLNAFSDPERADRAVYSVVSERPDVAVFPEAYDAQAPDCQALLKKVERRFSDAGYRVSHVPYDDPEHYEYEHGFMAICRMPGIAEVVRNELRNSVQVTTSDPTTNKRLTVLGVHLDHFSEERRQSQVEELLLHHVPDGPVVVAGDMNAMHGDDKRAQILRSPFTRRVAARLPDIGRLRNDAVSLAGMADGGTLKMLERADLRDADPLHHLTMKSRLPLVQLDHIFVSEEVQVDGFWIMKHNPISDHRGIIAQLTVASSRYPGGMNSSI